MTAVIETQKLTKKYGSIAAVNGLTISIPSGVVAGFVGPNGAGKSTTIRMLLGLVFPTSGSASVLGKSITHPHDYLHTVGALIESPAFYPSLSGKDNMKVFARLAGYPENHIDSLLTLVGLHDRASDRVSRYSLGMKQRLGIAIALLPDPELLILDEPVNGLDPPGIIEVRELLRRLRGEGKTIFISSHLLSEVEQIADWLVVLKDGSSLYCGKADELPREANDELVVAAERTDQLDVVAKIARDKGYSVTHSGNELHIIAPPQFAADLNRLSMNAGVTLVELHRAHTTLEETFLSMIGGEK